MTKPRLFKEERKLEDMKKVQIETDQGTVKEMQRQKKVFQRGKHIIKLSWLDRRKLKTDPEHTYIITMWFANGTCKTWVLKSKKRIFKQSGKHYYIHYEESYYDISLNQYHLYYHENFPNPINREVVKQGNEVYFSITPENLKDFIDMKYTEVLARSQTPQINYWLVGGIAIGAIIILIIIMGNVK
jgi:hypothetical protein